jgi:hypothetical protein
MRACLYMLLTGIALTAMASEAHAQRFNNRDPRVVSTPIRGINNFSPTYVSPYQLNVVPGVYPNLYGGYNPYNTYQPAIIPGAYPSLYNPFYTAATALRPVYLGPYYSIVWDPIANTYRYGSGYLNTPNYGYPY